MVITRSNVCYYLLERGLLSTESVVDGDLLVVEVTRRNRNFKIIRQHARSFFLKQIQNWEPQAIASLQREATCYWLAQTGVELKPLAALMPAYCLYDPARHIVVTELLSEGENLSDYHRRSGQFPTEAARQLGEALGTYHRETGGKLKESLQNSVFPKQVPWILSANQQNAHLVQALSAGNAELLKIVQKYPEFHQALDEMRHQWRTDALIHGDIKWDNCVLCSSSNGNGQKVLKIVDWELADVGDACWDIGAVFQAYLSFWILSIPVYPGFTSAQLLKQAQFPLEAMVPAMHSFWNAYVATRRVTEVDAPGLLERCVKYGAARMIQTAYEYLQYSAQVTPQVLSLLQVSLNILKDPRDAVFHLLEM
jgi:thiamine kinase-like enzyme